MLAFAPLRSLRRSWSSSRETDKSPRLVCRSYLRLDAPYLVCDEHSGVSPRPSHRPRALRASYRSRRKTYSRSLCLCTPLERLVEASTETTRASRPNVSLPQLTQLQDPPQIRCTLLGCHVTVRLFSLDDRRRTLSQHEGTLADMSTESTHARVPSALPANRCFLRLRAS